MERGARAARRRPDQGPGLTPQQELALWERWCGQRDPEARARLVEHHLPFARFMAARVYRGRFGDEIEFDDYFQLATIGLLEAVDRFDYRREASFRTFAGKRMRGAVLDGLPQQNEKQQQIALRQRLAQMRTASLCAEAEETPASSPAFVALAEVAIGMALGYMLEGSDMYLAGEEGTDMGYAGVELRQLVRQVRALVERLPERERLVIKYHYFQHLPFEAASAVLGLSKGRVSQLHQRALRLLREACQATRQCDATW